MSFRIKIMLGITLIQAALLFTMIWNSTNTLTSSHEAALLKHASVTTHLFASITQDALLATDLGVLENAVTQILNNPAIVYARIIGRQGVLAEGGDQQALTRPFRADQRYDDVNDGVFDFYSDITVANETYGRVEIGFSIRAIQDTINRARNETLGFAVFAMVVVALFCYIFATYLTRRLDALKTASQKISRGQFGDQTPVQGQDELAQTIVAFNDMSSRLQLLDEERKKSEHEVKKLNAELEDRVALRTHQLESANKQLEHISLHDALTALPNRTLFYDRAEQVILLSKRNNKSCALISMDLDRFKQINDMLGHHAGDLALQEAALRFKHCLRKSDTVARMGGDEFAILLPNVATVEDVITIINKIMRAIIKPMTIDNQIMTIGASIGVVLFPEHGEDLSTLLHHSDSAMYTAKRTQAGYAIFNAGTDKNDNAHTVLQLDLQRAINDHQLILHYQPKIDLDTQRVIGVEALVRWQHPERGLIYPDAFIPIAEKNGLIKFLTMNVLEMALHQCESWYKNNIHLSVAVNISTINLQDALFPEQVADMLKKFTVPCSYLELEITETAIMTNPLRSIENITKLNEMGIQVSIDDFGTGYSSMAYLKKLLVTTIKIDKSFVIDMDKNKNDDVIVRSTIDLGHNLGLKVIAEGVENMESWNRLKELGCDSAQGYFMSRPIPADQLMEWLKESPFGLKT